MTKRKLSEGLVEAFNFTLKGHEYSFRYPNTEELDEFKDVDTKDIKSFVRFISQFIDPVSKSAPTFMEIQKKMIVTEWSRFGEMITEEFKA